MVTSAVVYGGFLLLLGCERLGELVLSRRNTRRIRAQGGVEVGMFHFRIMAIMHTLFLVACAVEVFALDRPFPPIIGYVALGVALLAQALRYWAIITLGERWNVRILVLPSAAPVTGGPYRYLRHPNYVAVVLEIAAVPLIHGAWLTALCFSLMNALILMVRIKQEEQALGPQYAQAFAALPRMVPRLTATERPTPRP
jgi:methyltransferase